MAKYIYRTFIGYEAVAENEVMDVTAISTAIVFHLKDEFAGYNGKLFAPKELNRELWDYFNEGYSRYTRRAKNGNRFKRHHYRHGR
jgi:hypothetical protein